MKNKLRAFTITELMAVTLISTITVTAAFSAYRIIDTQIREYSKDNEKTLDLSTLKGLLANDFLIAKKVFKNSNEISLLMDNGSVIYSISDYYVVRRQSKLNSRNDTFEIRIEESIFKLKNSEVENGLIDFTAFKVKLTPMIKSNLSFSKKYSSADLFEYYGSQN